MKKQDEMYGLLPDPMSAVSRLNPGAWAPPATVLSVGSMFVLGAVFIVLRSIPTVRALFRLPISPVAVSIVAALLAGVVAWRCRSRPGGLFPRLWALVLTAIAIFTIGYSVTQSDLSGSSDRHIAALSVALAVITLALRWLVRVRPNQKIIAWIGVIAIVCAMTLAVVPTWAAVNHALDQETQSIADRVQEIRRLTARIKEVTALDWAKEFRRDLAGTHAKIDALAQIKTEPLIDPQLWRTAVILGREQQLTEAYEEYLGAIVDGFGPEIGPHLSKLLREPPLVYDRGVWKWTSEELPALSRAITHYDRHLGRLLVEARPPTSSALEKSHQAAQKRFQGSVEALKEHGADIWELAVLPEPPELMLADLVATKISPALPFAASDLPKLTKLPLAEAAKAGSSRRGCYFGGYEDDGRSYERLGCFVYQADKELGARLEVEARVVYSGGPLPLEVYFHFVVPPKKNPGAYRAEVMKALHDVARANGSTIGYSSSRNMNPAEGFNFLDEGEKIGVSPVPSAANFGGQTAIAVRAVRM